MFFFITLHVHLLRTPWTVTVFNDILRLFTDAIRFYTFSLVETAKIGCNTPFCDHNEYDNITAATRIA